MSQREAAEKMTGLRNEMRSQKRYANYLLEMGRVGEAAEAMKHYHGLSVEWATMRLAHYDAAVNGR